MRDWRRSNFYSLTSSSTLLGSTSFTPLQKKKLNREVPIVQNSRIQFAYFFRGSVTISSCTFLRRFRSRLIEIHELMRGGSAAARGFSILPRIQSGAASGARNSRREDVVSAERREAAAYEILKHPVRQGLRVPRASRRNEFQPGSPRTGSTLPHRGLYSIIPVPPARNPSKTIHRSFSPCSPSRICTFVKRVRVVAWSHRLISY